MANRKPKVKKILVPSMRAEAHARFAEVYEAAYGDRFAAEPQLARSLIELARVEVQLDWADQELEKYQASDDPDAPFLATTGNGEQAQAQIFKVITTLRAGYLKLLTAANLAVGKKDHLRAKPPGDNADELVKGMR